MSEINSSIKVKISTEIANGSLKPIYRFLIWVPPIAVMLAAGVAFHFVKFAFLSNPALNGLILLVMIWGAISMALHIRNCYIEDKVFFTGIDWLLKGNWGNDPNPMRSEAAHVQGMLQRLDKLGLGHQVYIQGAAMEPEIKALELYFEKKQELSNFLVGLMVGLGLLGTFIGLLETLVATSELIGNIATSLTSSGGNMEAEFSRLVSGLQKPLSSMGTAFSASMFGLVGSITLGFQSVIVNKTVATLVENIRDEVLSLSEKSKGDANVEITERYLATLISDLMKQHHQIETKLEDIVGQIATLVPNLANATLSNKDLAEAVLAQNQSLKLAISAVGHVQDVAPLISELALATSSNLNETIKTRVHVSEITSNLPIQKSLNENLQFALQSMHDLRIQVVESNKLTDKLAVEVKQQAATLKRMDAVLWNSEVSLLSQSFKDDES